MMPLDAADASGRPQREPAAELAAAGGHPFVAHHTPAQYLHLARSGVSTASVHLAPDELTERYLTGRTDDLRPAQAAHLIVATIGGDGR